MTQAIKDYHCRWFGYFLVLVTAVIFYGLLALGLGVLLGHSGKAAALEANASRLGLPLAAQAISATPGNNDQHGSGPP
ncbi:MAG: hypothetical protein AB9Q19_01485 [Candidatus Reddybacter sp.]